LKGSAAYEEACKFVDQISQALAMAQ